MDFGTQMLLAFFVTCALSIPIILYKYRKFKKEGKSVKYLEFKITMMIGLPIMSVPMLLSDLSLKWKVIAIILAALSGIAYAYGLTSARKSFRKILGLPPEDEDTGEVIKEDKKEK